MSTLCSLGPAARKAHVDRLVAEVFGPHDLERRRNAVWLMQFFASAGDAPVLALLSASRLADPWMRRHALIATGASGGELDDDAFASLMRELDQPGRHERGTLSRRLDAALVLYASASPARMPRLLRFARSLSGAEASRVLSALPRSGTAESSAIVGELARRVRDSGLKMPIGAQVSDVPAAAASAPTPTVRPRSAPEPTQTPLDALYELGTEAERGDARALRGLFEAHRGAGHVVERAVALRLFASVPGESRRRRDALREALQNGCQQFHEFVPVLEEVVLAHGAREGADARESVRQLVLAGLTSDNEELSWPLRCAIESWTLGAPVGDPRSPWERVYVEEYVGP